MVKTHLVYDEVLAFFPLLSHCLPLGQLLALEEIMMVCFSVCLLEYLRDDGGTGSDASEAM